MNKTLFFELFERIFSPSEILAQGIPSQQRFSGGFFNPIFCLWDKPSPKKGKIFFFSTFGKINVHRGTAATDALLGVEIEKRDLNL